MPLSINYRLMASCGAIIWFMNNLMPQRPWVEIQQHCHLYEQLSRFEIVNIMKVKQVEHIK
jgi:hypothetical protein